MGMTTWALCTKHNIYYPDDTTCPACKRELDKREQQALAVKWKEVIPFEQQVDFLRGEVVYCREQEREYDWYRQSQDNNKREHARVALLEARAEYLRNYAITILKMTEEQFNVYQSEGGN